MNLDSQNLDPQPNTAPRVSVIVPNYNHARFLARRIDSVLTQTFRDFEVIYLDDASTDNSAEVFARFAADPRIRAVLNTANTGIPFKQWNRGVAEAQGELIWLAEADDYADPHFLAEMVERLDGHPEVGIAFCQSQIVDENDVLSGLEQNGWDIEPQRWRHDFVMNGRDYARRFMLRDNTLPNASAVVFRKQVFEAMGGAPTSFRLSGDWLTWIQMLSRTDVAFVAQPLNFFRTHSGSVRSQNSKAGTYVAEKYRMAPQIARELQLSAAQKENLCHLIMENWRFLIFMPQQARNWRTHVEIFRTARRFDSRVGPRLFKHLVYGLFHQTALFQTVRHALRRSSS